MTMLDALDTLHVMGMYPEFDEARAWILENLYLDKITGDVSVFETIIRAVGGLEAAYELTRDKMFLNNAQEIVDR
jgi:Glycosyl hydrolase family 47